MDSLKSLSLSLVFLVAFPLSANVLPPHAVISADGRELLIPVAGRVVGAGGELFTTDLTLVNLAPVDQRVELVWLPAGGTSAPQVAEVTLERYAYATYADAVPLFFGTSGLGAIHVRPVAGAGAASAALDAHARIWTETTCGDLRGTVSQSVPAAVLDGWRNGSPAYVHGVTDDAQFRASYGIVNLTGTAREFRVIVNSTGARITETVTVPPFGVLQRRVPEGPSGSLSLYFEPLGAAGPWRAYATSTDNRSGSGWTVLALQPRTDLQF